MEVLANTIFVKIVGAENGNRIAIAMDGSRTSSFAHCANVGQVLGGAPVKAVRYGRAKGGVRRPRTEDRAEIKRQSEMGICMALHLMPTHKHFENKTLDCTCFPTWFESLRRCTKCASTFGQMTATTTRREHAHI